MSYRLHLNVKGEMYKHFQLLGNNDGGGPISDFVRKHGVEVCSDDLIYDFVIEDIHGFVEAVIEYIVKNHDKAFRAGWHQDTEINLYNIVDVFQHSYVGAIPNTLCFFSDVIKLEYMIEPLGVKVCYKGDKRLVLNGR